MRPPLTYEEKNHPRFKNVMDRMHGNGWFYNHSHNFSLGAAPKCGTSSIKQFIWMHELEDSFVPIQHHQVVDPIYFVARHPFDRFCSVWKSKCRDAMPSRHREVISKMSPTELMDCIDTGTKDVHWAPQVDLLAQHKAKLIPLELFGFWWKQSSLGKLDKFNATEGEVEIDDDLKARILVYYAEDVELYHKAQRDFCWATIHNLNS